MDLAHKHVGAARLVMSQPHVVSTRLKDPLKAQLPQTGKCHSQNPIRPAPEDALTIAFSPFVKRSHRISFSKSLIVQPLFPLSYFNLQ